MKSMSYLGEFLNCYQNVTEMCTMFPRKTITAFKNIWEWVLKQMGAVVDAEIFDRT